MTDVSEQSIASLAKTLHQTIEARAALRASRQTPPLPAPDSPELAHTLAQIRQKRCANEDFVLDYGQFTVSPSGAFNSSFAIDFTVEETLTLSRLLAACTEPIGR